jgi:hypothetical protein
VCITSKPDLLLPSVPLTIGAPVREVPPNDELQRTRDGTAAASPLNSVLGGPNHPADGPR